MITIGLFLFVVWLVLIMKHLVVGLGKSVVSSEELNTRWYRFEAENTDSHRLRASLGWSLMIGILSAALLTALVLSGR